uniref:Uncharacterized protein n=1 Tax=Trichogramma kaykai TaxID=54128 RepID=A0ABD2WG64_9HYME
MIDAFGVGICIACISYLCCICTTTIVACSALKRQKNDIKSCRGYSKPSSSSRNRSSRVAVQQKQPSSSRAVKKCDSGSESRCPCAEKQQKYFSCCSPCAQQAKRKAYLETSSFLNFEDADLSVASGKCAKGTYGAFY